MGSCTTRAVSYTHLDVYKRQTLKTWKKCHFSKNVCVCVRVCVCACVCVSNMCRIFSMANDNCHKFKQN